MRLCLVPYLQLAPLEYNMSMAKPTPRKLNTGAILSGVAALVFIGLLMVAFVQAASPYVTVAEARKAPGDSLHLPGDLVKGTVTTDRTNGVVRFALTDANGERIQVVCDGSVPSNLSDATKIVAIGKLQGNQFVANKLLVKCPSKYEAETKS